ncbi:MAG: DUF4278 domain-containing protein [Nostocaceae cyanobacterium]|nr:DUF4278 domain-containing protein [Nostocaceae cyanobacterium]
MKLKYRGVDYEYHPLGIEVSEGELSGKYRGGSWRYHYPRHIGVPQTAAELKYRSVPYYTGSPQAVAQMIQRKQQNQAVSLSTAKRVGTQADELAQVHLSNIRRNLERRLQAARQRGDINLINLLEDEVREFA